MAKQIVKPDELDPFVKKLVDNGCESLYREGVKLNRVLCEQKQNAAAAKPRSQIKQLNEQIGLLKTGFKELAEALREATSLQDQAFREMVPFELAPMENRAGFASRMNRIKKALDDVIDGPIENIHGMVPEIQKYRRMNAKWPEIIDFFRQFQPVTARVPRLEGEGPQHGKELVPVLERVHVDVPVYPVRTRRGEEFKAIRGGASGLRGIGQGRAREGRDQNKGASLAKQSREFLSSSSGRAAVPNQVEFHGNAPRDTDVAEEGNFTGGGVNADEDEIHVDNSIVEVEPDRGNDGAGRKSEKREKESDKEEVKNRKKKRSGGVGKSDKEGESGSDPDADLRRFFHEKLEAARAENDRTAHNVEVVTKTRTEHLNEKDRKHAEGGVNLLQSFLGVGDNKEEDDEQEEVRSPKKPNINDRGSKLRKRAGGNTDQVTTPSPKGGRVGAGMNCRACGKFFPQSSNCYRHMRHMHGIQRGGTSTPQKSPRKKGKDKVDGAVASPSVVAARDDGNDDDNDDSSDDGSDDGKDDVDQAIEELIQEEVEEVVKGVIDDEVDKAIEDVNSAPKDDNDYEAEEDYDYDNDDAEDDHVDDVAVTKRNKKLIYGTGEHIHFTWDYLDSA